MTRERVVSPKEVSQEEESWNLSLRPQVLNEFIGQKGVVDKLSISLAAAKKREEPLEHMLLYGPPGLGKTTLAHIISRETNCKIFATSGPALERSADLIGILTNLQEGDILFIDEIHRLSTIVEEFLYPAMEDFKIDFVVDKGAYAKTLNVPLKRFTLIGATTRAGFLSAPLRERFGLTYHLTFYETEDLVKIVKRSSGLLSIEIGHEVAHEVAKRSRGTPRIANRLLKRVRDFAQVKAAGKISLDSTIESLKIEGIDHLGLDELDKKYIKVILDHHQGGPVGIETIAATLNEAAETLEEMVEPYLLKIGLLSRTRLGRKVNESAIKSLKIENLKIPSSQGNLF
ncbi:MAG: Holliday junction DNA helicase RuvB [Elusimicrobia bacterium RIFCSPLOWO2_02_FULL_39_32]|nr:MAG: Holliday junction DNA helicase RuvB [Elusimicrobia bacterium RIFCSPHIGHO2_02_FULL_39_36]OGR92969.1 MAG: Holliday junction DNA helicase RuvB [Elusimicrobia bacterium RIFCSPLOWO2_02_FULL_39_32]OGR99752.1 MAG: Holliday junction DNA helicase RuvB [Elusimicrobia bacterium RIFCSPLOWO2_12_FULL_39_28]